jgi:hypothetical protein
MDVLRHAKDEAVQLADAASLQSCILADHTAALPTHQHLTSTPESFYKPS